jgi:hypothetical protein
MRAMPLERKQYLIHQSRQSRNFQGKASSSQSPRQNTKQMTPGSPKAVPATPLSPQNTGGVFKRFSLWGSASPSIPPSPSTPTQSEPQEENAVEALPLIPQITGSLWGNWWTSSPRESDNPSEGGEKTSSTEWYVSGIKNGKTTDNRLVKHLISLRVHLSTAKVTWVEVFLNEEKGMDALANLLASLVGKLGKRFESFPLADKD